MNCKYINENNKIDIDKYNKIYCEIIEKFFNENYKKTSLSVIQNIIAIFLKNIFTVYTKSTDIAEPLISQNNEFLMIKTRKEVLFEICDKYIDLNNISRKYNKIDIIFNEKIIHEKPLYECRNILLSTKETRIYDLFVPAILSNVYYSELFFTNPYFQKHTFLKHALIFFCRDTNNNDVCIFTKNNNNILMDNIKSMRNDIDNGQNFCVEYNYLFNEKNTNNNLMNVFSVDRDNLKVSYCDIINEKIKSITFESFGDIRSFQKMYFDAIEDEKISLKDILLTTQNNK